MTSSEAIQDHLVPVRSGIASVNGGIELCYEDRGPVDGDPLLLIMGLSAQMLVWPEGFCDLLVQRGYRVIRFDNRDIGLSTKVRQKVAPMNELLRMARFSLGLKSPSPYSLYDMARDAEGLLDHLGIRQAHVVGASMGGMIAQILAGTRPERVKSLGVIFSSTNQPLLPPPHPEAIGPLMKGPGKGASTDQLIAHSVKLFNAIGSPGYPEPHEERVAFARRLFERSYHPAGVKRQFTAVLSSGSLKPVARKITAPTVVIHGREDRLVRPGCGKAVARAIRGAELHLIPGMGHDLPRALWPKFVHLIDANAKRR